MILSWKEFKNLNDSDIMNFKLPDKSFREMMFFKKIKSDFILDDDLCLLFNYEDNIVDKSYEFDVLFIQNPKKKLKNNKKIICNIEFHDYYLESNYDEKDIQKDFLSKKSSAIDYFSDLLLDQENYCLDFYFYYKISKEKTELIRETLSFKNMRKLKEKNYIDYYGEENIELILNYYKKQAFSIKKIIKSVKGKKHKKIDSILANMDDYKYFCVEGHAGTGKTVVALQIKEILEKRGHSVLFQLINERFFDQLIKSFENKDNFFCLTKDIINSLNKNKIDFLIIDEAQRMSKEIFQYLGNTKLIILGDDRQKIRPSYDSFSIKKFYNENTKESLFFKLKIFWRFSKNDFQWMDYIFTNKNKPPSRDGVDFKIKIFENIEDFKNHFYNSTYRTKCFTSLIHGNDSKITPFIKTAPWNLPYKHFFLEIPKLYENYIFSPYDIISREVDSNFIYLPYEFEIEEKKSKLEFHYSLKKNGEGVDFYQNQFWVLLTRSTQEIVFYSENKKTREYLKNKCFDYNNAKIIAKKSN